MGRSRALASGVRTAMKRQFCRWKDVGAVVPVRTSSRIWSSLKVAAGSKYLVALRLTIHSMTALVMVIFSCYILGPFAAVHWLSGNTFRAVSRSLKFMKRKKCCPVSDEEACHEGS